MRTSSYTSQSPRQLGRKQVNQHSDFDSQSPMELAKAFGFERHTRVNACPL